MLFRCRLCLRVKTVREILCLSIGQLAFSNALPGSISLHTVCGMIVRSSVPRCFDAIMPKRTLDAFFPALSAKKTNVGTKASVEVSAQVPSRAPVASLASAADLSSAANAAPGTDADQPRPAEAAVGAAAEHERSAPAGTAPASAIDGPAKWHNSADR